MTDSLGGGIDSRKEINLWLLQTVYCYSLFHMLVNKLLELNEVLIHLFVAVSLRINATLTQ